MAKRKKRATGAKRKSAPRGKVRKGSVSARGKAAKRTVAKSKPRKGLAQASTRNHKFAHAKPLLIDSRNSQISIRRESLTIHSGY